MDLLTILLALLSLGGALALKMTVGELQDWLPTIARKLVDRAASQLPKAKQARYREEWYAHLDECPGRVGKIWHSIGCVFSAKTLARELNKSTSPLAKSKYDDVVPEVVRQIIKRLDHARLIELYYWTREPKLLEIVRTVSAIPTESREELALFLLAAGDPRRIIINRDSDGRLTMTWSDSQSAE
jgi:hypothetical protein